DHHHVDVVTAGDALVDALESQPALGRIAVDEPRHRGHAQHDAGQQHDSRAGQAPARIASLQVRDDRHEGGEVDDVIGRDVEPATPARGQHLEARDLPVTAVEDAAGPETGG